VEEAETVALECGRAALGSVDFEMLTTRDVRKRHKWLLGLVPSNWLLVPRKNVVPPCPPGSIEITELAGFCEKILEVQ
jgi:hypothetical protein